MDPLVIAIALITFISTVVGGSFAIKYRSTIHYFFAFASGSLVAVALLDILPESISISAMQQFPLHYLMLITVISFLAYTFLEKFFLTHHQHGEHPHIIGPIGAGSLVIHSFLDGVAIGTAFQLSPKIGIIIALAVIFHDFTDGINTVTLMLKNRQKLGITRIFLFLDGLAPLLGVFATYIIALNALTLAMILAAFAGEFLYIGASSLLPETHKHDSFKMASLMALGALLIAVLTSIL